MEEKKFLYSDVNEQIRRANWVLILGLLVYSIIILLTQTIAYLSGSRSLGLTGLIYILVIGFLVGETIPYLKNRSNKASRYIAIVGSVIVGFLVGFAFNSYYVRFMTILPFMGTVVFFDYKYQKRATIAMSIMQVVVSLLKTVTGQNMEDVSISDLWSATAALVLLLIFAALAVKTVLRFQTDTLGKLAYEKEVQDKMVTEIVAVAEDIKNTTSDAMGIVNDLNESTGTVHGAVSDISDSTSNTAENIQTQTVMTQSIQEAISETRERSEEMVKAAEKTSDLNAKNVELMNNLKVQSEAISIANSNVALTMDALKEKANAVKSIAGTILAISSQTNLLALNASIESARAGEAGRGFAVVADEIRELAEKTRKETGNISDILDELSSNAESAALAVNNSVQANNEQSEMIQLATESFAKMNENVTSVTDSIAVIDKMLESLSNANDQIVDNIMQLSATTEEVSAASCQAMELSANNLQNSDDTKAILEGIIEKANELNKYTL